jgi:hypothetical protein
MLLGEGKVFVVAATISAARRCRERLGLKTAKTLNCCAAIHELELASRDSAVVYLHVSARKDYAFADLQRVIERREARVEWTS